AGNGRLEPILEVGNIKLDLDRRLVFVGHREIHLTPHEYHLLAYLMKHVGKVVTHPQLLKEVWRPDHKNQREYLRVYMVQLRRKLEADPSHPRYLLTEPGIGYRLKDFRRKSGGDGTKTSRRTARPASRSSGKRVAR